jgi:hypothetical protein
MKRLLGLSIFAGGLLLCGLGYLLVVHDMAIGDTLTTLGIFICFLGFVVHAWIFVERFLGSNNSGNNGNKD